MVGGGWWVGEGGFGGCCMERCKRRRTIGKKKFTHKNVSFETTSMCSTKGEKNLHLSMATKQPKIQASVLTVLPDDGTCREGMLVGSGGCLPLNVPAVCIIPYAKSGIFRDRQILWECTTAGGTNDTALKLALLPPRPALQQMRALRPFCVKEGEETRHGTERVRERGEYWLGLSLLVVPPLIDQ